jgi:hypothetical protein
MSRVMLAEMAPVVLFTALQKPASHPRSESHPVDGQASSLSKIL